MEVDDTDKGRVVKIEVKTEYYDDIKCEPNDDGGAAIDDREHVSVKREWEEGAIDPYRGNFGYKVRVVGSVARLVESLSPGVYRIFPVLRVRV